MITILEILIVLLFIGFVFFVGLWIYGIRKDKKEQNLFGTSKQVWIGLIGLNVCNVLVQIVNLMIKAIN